MNKEEDKQIKEQVEELKELLKTIKIGDRESKEDVTHIQQQLNKFLKKMEKNEN